MNEVINLINRHRSIRKYENRPIDSNIVVELVKAAQNAPSSSFVQAYTIIRVTDEEKRKKLAFLGGDQKYIEEAPEFFVFCGDLHRLDIACRLHNTAMRGEFTEAFILATVDTAIAAQNMMVAAEALGLGGVYIGGIRNNPDKISDILELPHNVYPVFGMCIGYPAENPDHKPRLPVELVFMENTYNVGNELEKIKEYDNTIKEYYSNRTEGKRIEGWTELMARKMEKELRPFMREFLNKKGFEMK